MTHSPKLFISLAFLTVDLIATCIFATLDSGYDRPGVAGGKIPDEASLRLAFEIAASASLMVPTPRAKIWIVQGTP